MVISQLSVELSRFLALVTAPERRGLAWLLGGMMAMGLVEAVGLSSVLPFMAILGNPAMIGSNAFLAAIYEAGGFRSTQAFLVFLGGFALAVIVIANLFALFINWQIVRLANQLGHSLSVRVLERYVSQPYSFFLDKLSSNLTLNATGEVAGLINGVVLPMLQLASRAIAAAFLVLLVVTIDPLTAGLFAAFFGGAYLLIFRAVQRKLARLGEENQAESRTKFRAATTLFQGIKDLKVLGRVDYYIGTFERSSASVAKNQSINGVVAILPRHALETLGIGGMLAAALYLLIREGDLGKALPLLALFALAAYRLIPALQGVFVSMTQIRFNLPSLRLLHAEMQGTSSNQTAVPHPHEEFEFKQQIELRNVAFSYGGRDKPVLADLSLVIPRNATIGVMGTTGAGKTTVVDLMLGLISPQSGELRVDGRVVDQQNAPAWRRKVGYVPQVVFLSEESIASNIAFGVPVERIDHERVKIAARVANIHEFIESELPQGYETPIGERGIRLSGGQRQRIGIARALYTDPEVLVLDEATSSLDSITEDAVIDAIRQLSHRKTIIAVAHRLTTLQGCDLIYLVSDGRVSDSGSFAELLERNATFRAMARVNERPR